MEFKHVKKDLDLMRNRVNLLRSQLQKEKDSISKHKSMTEDMIRKKVEISKITSLVGIALARKIKTLQPFHRTSSNSGNATTPIDRYTKSK